MNFSKKNLFESYYDDVEERRSEREWELGPDCPDEGLKAHALLEWLRNNGDVQVRTPEQTERLDFLRSKLEELEDNGDESTEEEASEIKDEIQELESAIDVYEIIPNGNYYEMDEFVIPTIYGTKRRYAVGTESETKDSAEESVRQLWKELGPDGFSSSFLTNHLDEDKIVDMAETNYSDDIYSNPEVYLDESQRELTTNQEESIKIYELRISQLKDKIYDYSESELDLESEINELEEMISEMEDEIESIKDDPNGDFPDELIQAKIEDLVDDVRSNPQQYLDGMGMDYNDFIDEESLIEDVVDTDGYGHVLNHYDGNADEVKVLETLYWVMRID